MHVNKMLLPRCFTLPICLDYEQLTECTMQTEKSSSVIGGYILAINTTHNIQRSFPCAQCLTVEHDEC